MENAKILENKDYLKMCVDVGITSAIGAGIGAFTMYIAYNDPSSSLFQQAYNIGYFADAMMIGMVGSLTLLCGLKTTQLISKNIKKGSLEDKIKNK